jgi:hypothetical protein
MASDLNLLAGWAGVVLGCIFGAVSGIFFQKEDWLGGYSSWSRRMLRLAHVSFFGLGFINIAFAITARQLAPSEGLLWPSALLIVGAAGMPLLCTISAFHQPARHLLAVPVLSVIGALGLFLWRLWAG